MAGRDRVTAGPATGRRQAYAAWRRLWPSVTWGPAAQVPAWAWALITGRLPRPHPRCTLCASLGRIANPATREYERCPLCDGRGRL